MLESIGTDSSSLHSCGRFWSTFGSSTRFTDFFHDLAAFDEVKVPCFVGYRAVHTLCSSTRYVLLCNKQQTELIECRSYQLLFRVLEVLGSIFGPVCDFPGRGF
jgi:hypothetical protein